MGHDAFLLYCAFAAGDAFEETDAPLQFLLGLDVDEAGSDGSCRTMSCAVQRSHELAVHEMSLEALPGCQPTCDLGRSLACFLGDLRFRGRSRAAPSNSARNEDTCLLRHPTGLQHHRQSRAHGDSLQFIMAAFVVGDRLQNEASEAAGVVALRLDLDGVEVELGLALRGTGVTLEKVVRTRFGHLGEKARDGSKLRMFARTEHGFEFALVNARTDRPADGGVGRSE